MNRIHESKAPTQNVGGPRRTAPAQIAKRTPTTPGRRGVLMALALASIVWSGTGNAQAQTATSLELHLPSTLLVKGEADSGQIVLCANELGNPSAWVPCTSVTLSALGIGTVEFSATQAPKRFYRTLLATAGLSYIPAGTFTMGSPPGEAERDAWEGPQTQVTLTRPFWMGKHEVTQGEYLAVMGDNPSFFNGVQVSVDYGTDLNRPVESVTWNDATNYCARLTDRERQA